jgi:hypothetical protein
MNREHTCRAFKNKVKVSILFEMQRKAMGSYQLDFRWEAQTSLKVLNTYMHTEH